MWLFVMFDLPVKTRKERKTYTRFRSNLLAEGFSMLQFSVYARYCPSEESAASHRRHIRQWMPGKGQVRILSVTEHQFSKMEIHFGKKRHQAEQPPQQLTLF